MTTASIPSYYALALQTTCFAVNGLSEAEARTRMMMTIDRISAQIRASKAFIGQDLKLVVLPEYFLTSFPLRESIAQWQALACVQINGAEYDALRQTAQSNGVYLSGNLYELDPHFPELYFQTSFCIDPDGEVVLRYRRLNSMFAPTPHDVWDKYLEVYGLEQVFPIADTAIGRLGAVASEEILYPEISRMMVMRGAEILLHSSSEASSPQQMPKEIARRARAIENMVYVVSANSAAIAGITIPADSTNGHSQIIDPKGQIIAEAAQGESMVAHAEIDLESLRRLRRRPGMSNYLARQRFELYAQMYAQHSFYPANTLLNGIEDKSQFLQQQLATIRKLSDSRVI
jgi:predicted amidohydrolase